MSRTAEHLHHLSTVIGPRPATTDAEAEAADYVESVFRERRVDVERQEFDAPRTYAWAFALYHLLTIGAAVASGWSFLAWPAFAVSAVVAFLLWMDLDTRFGLTAWLPPKGPSQNVIARHVPRARRGERPTKVVIVAHYDTARSSLAFAPSMVKNFSVTFALMKVCTMVVPLLVLLGALPFTEGWQPWLWYVTIAASAYLVVPLLINVHREIAMGFVDGANDNASGVAVMLGVMERVVPEGEESATTSFAPVRRGRAAAESAGVVPEGAELEYEDESGSGYEPSSAGSEDPTELPDDFRWAEASPSPPDGGRPATQGSLEFETIEFSAIGEDASEHEAWDAVPPHRGPDVEREVDHGWDEPDRDTPDRSRPAAPPENEPAPGPARQRKGLLGRLGKKRSRETEDVGGWLGVDRGFDVRETGRKIGSWENFGDDDDDDFGFKGGRAGSDPLGDPEFAAAEASRIRKRVTERVDRALADKEIWFVATGAEETGTWGMKALLDTFGPELRGALIINLDNLGAGALNMVTEEGMARRYRADRRLLSAGKRVSRERELPVRTRVYRGLSTDATRALARGYRAMSLMAFDINGRLPNWHWRTDIEENVDMRNLEVAEEFVTEVVRTV